MSIQVHTSGGASGPPIVIGHPAQAIQIMTPGGGAVAGANWWELDGITVTRAYRAVSTEASPWGAGPSNLAESLVDLSGNQDASAPANDPSWSAAAGWGDFFTNGAHLTTGLAGPTDQTWTAIVRYTNASTAQTSAFGSRSSAHFFFIRPNYTSKHGFYYGNNQAILTGTGQAAGVMALRGRECYYNQTSIGTLGASAPALSGRLVYIGAQDNGGSVAEVFLGNIQAFWLAQSTISEADYFTMQERMAAL